MGNQETVGGALIIKVESSFKHPLWDLRDQTGSIRRKVRPSALPIWVRQAVDHARRAYFHAYLSGEAVVFKHRVVGNPGWE